MNRNFNINPIIHKTVHFRISHTNHILNDATYYILISCTSMIDESKVETILEIVEDFYGEETRKIAESLIQEEEISDEELSKEMDIRLPEIRKELYKLLDISITDYTRTQDPETHWHTFYWKFHPENTVSLINMLQEELDQKKEELTFQTEHSFFMCAKNKEIYTYESAMMQNFNCLLCESELKAYDNQPEINFLVDRINVLNGYIKDLT